MADSIPTHIERFDLEAYLADPARKPDADRVTETNDLGGGLVQIDYVDPPAPAHG